MTPRRVVCLCPSLTETVFDLGAGDTLVGATKFCIHPRPAVDKVEKVGGTKNPDVARIVALRPDLVIMNEEENRLQDAEAFQTAGLRVVSVLPASPREVPDALRVLGAALGRTETAAVFAERIANECETAVEPSRPLRFAYLIWRKPWMAVAPGTYVNGLLELAGGQNVVHADKPYPEVALTEIGAAHPDLVFLSTEPFPFAEKHIPEIAKQTGLDLARIHIVDGELLSWAGTRTLQGIPYARGLLAGIGATLTRASEP